MMTPIYNTKLFTNIYVSADDFLTDYNNLGIPKTITDTSVETLYYLLYARYGNSPIANYDENQFKYKLFGIIFQYGPAWEKKLELQKKIRELTEDDIINGGKAIYNTAMNPGTEPTTASLNELNYIDAQNTTNYKKSKMDAYALQWDLLEDDVSEKFLNKFKICFKSFVYPENPLLYITREDDDD